MCSGVPAVKVSGIKNQHQAIQHIIFPPYIFQITILSYIPAVPPTSLTINALTDCSREPHPAPINNPHINLHKSTNLSTHTLCKPFNYIHSQIFDKHTHSLKLSTTAVTHAHSENPPPRSTLLALALEHRTLPNKHTRIKLS